MFASMNNYTLANTTSKLFDEVTPTQLRHTIEDLFFQYQSGDFKSLTQDQIKDIHLLIQYLNEVEVL